MTPEDERSENEVFYDDVLAPALAELNRQCQERGMGFVATVEYNKDEFGSTVNQSASESDTLLLTYIAVRSHGNIDSLVINWMKHIRQAGRPHGSIVLNKMGLEPEVEKRNG